MKENVFTLGDNYHGKGLTTTSTISYLCGKIFACQSFGQT